MAHPLLTPSRPPPIPVDISTIEQQKENIQPLASGRSASQLAALSSQSRSTLGAKLATEHKRFQAQLAAVATYDEEGNWEDGHDGFSSDEVAAMAEDPLDPHHQYVRFVNGNYPAGASAQNRLVPLLEASTRAFVNDERYRNDPRYLRLWSMYAKNVDCPEDCYRFLFARGIGERLALLYEEYAFVLEAVGKRKEADQVYALGLARFAAPLERLKKRYLSFQARMLVAPPLPSPPPAATPSSSSSISRTILSSSGGLAIAPKAPMNENAAKGFAVFKDGDSAVEQKEGETWEDMGTVKSRKRENRVEGGEWKGETMPMGGSAKVAPLRLEVFRDSDAPLPSTSADPAAPSDVFSRSLRGPSEVELLRSNPFLKYDSADLSLASIDPLPPAPPLVPAVPTKKAASRTKAGSTKSKATALPAGDRPTRVACDLDQVYPPGSGREYSFEEIKFAKGGYGSEVESWGGWEWAKEWDEEVRRTGETSYVVDRETGWPLLYDLDSGLPLWDFVRKAEMEAEPVVEFEEPETQQEPSFVASPSPPPPAQQQRVLSPSPSPATRQPQAFVASPSPAPASALVDLLSPSPAPSHKPQAYDLLAASPSPSPRHTSPPVEQIAPLVLSQRSPSPPPRDASPSPRDASPPAQQESPSRAVYIDPRRPPSPTMNTRQAQALVDDLFAKTLNFGSGSLDSDEDDDEEPETEDDDEESPCWERATESQLELQSQFTAASSQESNAPFVPFSQSQASQLSDLEEESEESRPEPIRLFHDPVVANSTPGFRPTMRAPLGVKVGAPLFQVMRDEQENGGEVVPSSQLDEWEEAEADASFEEFETALREESPARGDGFAMGRRPVGTNRWAPFIDNMTPISERTYEFGEATRTTMSSLSTLQRSRRDSAYPVADVQEEDEDDSTESEDEDGDGDRAFVAYEEEEEDSDRSRNGSSESSEPETEDDDEETPVQQRDLPPPPMPQEDSSADWHNTTRKDGHFDNEENAGERSLGESAGQDRSFEVSLNTSLPEGYTITGNQSGMTTGMVLAETTNLGLTDAIEEQHKRRSEPTSSQDDFPNPCNPFSLSTIAQLLALAFPPILHHSDVRDLTHLGAGKLASLQKTAKRREAASKSKAKDRTGIVDEVWELELDGEVFSVREKLGEGSFGAVFRVAAPPADEDASFDEDADEETSIAVKVERPTNLWEFSILDQLHARLPPRIRTSVVSASRLYAFEDESYLFLDFCDQGTLLDAVNKANEAGIAPATGGASAGLEEIVAMFFVVELLRILEGFHNAGFVHGDLKIDNCLVRLQDVPGGARAWSTTYDRTGGGGWSAKGLKIVDFGRSIDLRAFPPTQQFLSELESDEFDCVEMREGRSWTYEPDYFGVASIAFNLLFGRYIETKAFDDDEGRTKYAINQNFKRYHQTELWTRLFDALLNPRSVRGGVLPITDELVVVRGEMEEWLTSNSDKNGKSLRGLIKKMEIYSMSR